MPKLGPKGKSSKTARVLGLLTDPESAEGAPASAESASESAKLADDRRTQAKIRGALEMELAETPAPARPPRPRHTPPPISSELRIVKEMPLPEFTDDEPLKEKTPEPEPVFSVPQSTKSPLESKIEELRSAGEKTPDEYICFNVTQALVEDKADKYIKMFGLCACPRCRIDVIALALSNLPPKYVVAQPNDLIPRLSIYEQKYNAAVVTQVMSACRRVLERPHHKREQN